MPRSNPGPGPDCDCSSRDAQPSVELPDYGYGDFTTFTEPIHNLHYAKKKEWRAQDLHSSYLIDQGKVRKASTEVWGV